MGAEHTLEQLYCAHLDRNMLSDTASTTVKRSGVTITLPSSAAPSLSAAGPSPPILLPLSATTPKPRPQLAPASSAPKPPPVQAPAKPVNAAATILPLRAASYFEDVACAGGEWILLIAGRALKEWRALKDPVRTGAVEKMLIALSREYTSLFARLSLT